MPAVKRPGGVDPGPRSRAAVGPARRDAALLGGPDCAQQPVARRYVARRRGPGGVVGLLGRRPAHGARPAQQGRPAPCGTGARRHRSGGAVGHSRCDQLPEQSLSGNTWRTITGAPSSGGISSTLMRWRKRRTHPAAVSAWRIRCSATGRSSSSSRGRSSATSSCFGPCPNSRPSWSSSPRFVASFCSTRPGSGSRTRSPKFARSMIELPRSRPSWTQSASTRPSFSV
jgi:hypothetical protein